MKSSLRSILTGSALCLMTAAISCGGDANTSEKGDGDSSGDGDGDGDAGDGDAGDGDSIGDGGTAGDGGAAGDGDAAGNGGSGATGLCREESCGGHCAPADPDSTACSDDWVCLNVLTCARDLVPYCGCDGETFQASSDCAPYAFAHRGACDDPIADGLNCDASQVVTDDLPPECEYGYLPRVVGSTWGPCVPIEECGCEGSGTQDDCGPEYVCYNTGRCGHLIH